MAIVWEKLAIQTDNEAKKLKAVHWKIINSENENSFYGVTDVSCISKDCLKNVAEMSLDEIINFVKTTLGETIVQEYENIVKFPSELNNTIVF